MRLRDSYLRNGPGDRDGTGTPNPAIAKILGEGNIRLAKYSLLVWLFNCLRKVHDCTTNILASYSIPKPMLRKLTLSIVHKVKLRMVAAVVRRVLEGVVDTGIAQTIGVRI